jgi:hypothetical protein
MRVTLALATVAAIVLVAWGQILNIVDLITGYATMTTNELVIRGLGLFVAPVGAWMGWF